MASSWWILEFLTWLFPRKKIHKVLWRTITLCERLALGIRTGSDVDINCFPITYQFAMENVVPERTYFVLVFPSVFRSASRPSLVTIELVHQWVTMWYAGAIWRRLITIIRSCWIFHQTKYWRHLESIVIKDHHYLVDPVLYSADLQRARAACQKSLLSI